MSPHDSASSDARARLHLVCHCEPLFNHSNTYTETVRPTFGSMVTEAEGMLRPLNWMLDKEYEIPPIGVPLKE